MIYTKRRVLRQRMMRRAVFTEYIRNSIAAIKGFVPEVVAAAAFMFMVFYLLPILYVALVGQFPIEVIP